MSSKRFESDYAVVEVTRMGVANRIDIEIEVGSDALGDDFTPTVAREIGEYLIKLADEVEAEDA